MYPTIINFHDFLLAFLPLIFILFTIFYFSFVISFLEYVFLSSLIGTYFFAYYFPTFTYSVLEFLYSGLFKYFVIDTFHFFTVVGAYISLTAFLFLILLTLTYFLKKINQFLSLPRQFRQLQNQVASLSRSISH